MPRFFKGELSFFSFSLPIVSKRKALLLFKGLSMKVVLKLTIPLLLSISAHAAVPMQAGLWELEITTSKNGKVNEDPFARINKLPKEQRDSLLKAMKMQVGSTPNSQRICYSKEDIQKYSLLNSNNAMSEYCTQKIRNISAKVVSSDITCKDGYKGTATMTYESPQKVQTVNEGINAKGDKITIKTNAKFISENCSMKL